VERIGVAMHRANPGLLALALLALGFSSAAVEGRIKHSTVHRSMVGRHFRIGVLKGSFPPYWTMTHVEDLVDMQELSVADGGELGRRSRHTAQRVAEDRPVAAEEELLTLSLTLAGIEGFLVGMVDAVMEELGATYTFVVRFLRVLTGFPSAPIAQKQVWTFEVSAGWASPSSRCL
jgi:hypothetical protein